MMKEQLTTWTRRIAFGLSLGLVMSASAISTTPLSVIPVVEQAVCANVSGLASQASILTNYDALDLSTSFTVGMVENVVNTPEAVVSTVLRYNTPVMLYNAYENWDTPFNLTADLSGLKAAWDQFTCPDPYVSSRAVGNLTSAVMMTIALGEMSKGPIVNPVKTTTLELDTATTWGRAETLTDHFARHGADFGASTADEYNMASRFLQESQAAKLPTKIDSQGVIRVFDPKTGTFGAFNPNGTTRTLFKPPNPSEYFARQPGALVP